MNDLNTTAAVLGLSLTVVILYLVRRDHLYLRDGLFWIGIAILSLILGIWPGLIDLIGRAVGIAYSPALLFLVVIIVLLVRTLLTDIALTRLRREVRRLNQSIALTSINKKSAPGDADSRLPPE